MSKLEPRRRMIWLVLWAFLISPAAFAHRSQSVLTSIVWNEREARLEVLHRLHTDDVEIGLAQLVQSVEPVDLAVANNRAALLAYLQECFTLYVGDRAVTLEPGGIEMRGPETLVSFDVQLDHAPDQLGIENRILVDLFSGQTNLVNVRMRTRTRTILFSTDDRTKYVKKLS